MTSGLSPSAFLGGPGHESYNVPLELFRENRKKLAARLCEESQCSSQTSNNEIETYLVVLKGGPSPTRFDTDHEPIFRQESYFWWLTGVKEPDCTLVLTVRLAPSNSNNATDQEENTHDYALFVPDLPASYATVMGKIRSVEEWRDLYGVQGGVFLDHQLETYIENCLSSNAKVLLLRGPNTDSGSMYEGLMPVFSEALTSNSLAIHGNVGDDPNTKTASATTSTTIVDTTTLFPILADCRVTKSKLELDLMEHVSQITSFAHAYVMRNVQPGMYEYQCESLFKHYAYYNYGSRLVSYTSICGCGPNAAILHYGHTGEPNARRISQEDSCLFDMGAEYQCYASDVTCSFPANGKFTPKYKAIYESVLKAQIAVYKMMAPGVSWVECHIAAELEIVKGLHAIGIVRLDNYDDDDNYDEPATATTTTTTEAILEVLVRKHRLGAVFMPHGLGHLIGIDTHDVGGYLPSTTKRSSLPGLKSLRTARTLKANMVLTVEPGCYFIDHLLDEAMEPTHPLSKYLDRELIDREYRGYGGVRLEDVVCVLETPDGSSSSLSCIHNFTLCPRTVPEVEAVMAGENWPPVVDTAPELRRLKLTTPISPLPPPPSR